MGEQDNIRYNPLDVESIVEYATQLKGKTLREVCELSSNEDLEKANKGQYGNTLQEFYFGIKPNSSPKPDFEHVGIELKVTPIKQLKNEEYRAKERLVFDMIDYEKVISETWENSSVLNKCAKTLLITYLFDDKKSQLDYEIKDAMLWNFPPEEDFATIKHDWEKIVAKIKAGQAHELSGSDTNYLEASTKSSDSTKRRKQPYSDIPAKPRAFALKASYMNSIYERSGLIQRIPRAKNEIALSLEELVYKRFQNFFGKSEDDLLEKFGISKNSKQRHALITKHILGIDEASKIAEFELADIITRTVRLKSNGRPKEDISFPVFNFCDVANAPWEESSLYENLSKRFLFVIFDIVDEETCILKDICFWGMPEEDFEACAKDCYEQTQAAIVSGKIENFPRNTTNRCCHVRLHGRNKNDTLPLPNGQQETKRCFWLNASYMKNQIQKARELQSFNRI